MVEPIKHFRLNQVTQYFKVYHIAGFRINFTGYLNGEFIVVSMIVLVVAQPKYGFIPLIGPGRIV